MSPHPSSFFTLLFFFFCSICDPSGVAPFISTVCYNTSLDSLSADLSKHKRYEIRLSVYNAVGEGPISAPQEVFVGEAGM